MKDLLSVRIESPALPAGRVHVADLRGFEEIGKLFEFVVRVIVDDAAGLDELAVLAHPASIVVERGGRPERSFFGIIAAVEDELLTEPGHTGYALTFVPRVWQLGLSKGSEVFLDKTVPEVLAAKLSRAGFKAGEDFEQRLLATYPKRELGIQYQETDLAFVSRLAEHAGISFFFEHRDGRDVVVFSDDNSGFKPAEGQARALFRPRGEALGVYTLKATTRTLPERVVVRDYNYRTPSVSLQESSAVADGGTGTFYDYGDHHATPEEARRLATIRAQELACTQKVFEGESDLGRFAAGVRTVLEGHARADGEYLILRVEHRAEQGTLSGGRGDEHAYRNHFRAIAAAIPYRSPRVTPKPRVLGVITGIIEAAQPGQYAELDDSGRYRVRFLFDNGDAAHGAASSLLRMAQPHAGPGYGFHFPLRDGVEVIVTCIDGDPDRPIITGAVPNPQTPSPVGAKNGQRNVIRTGGGTEINLDDTEGGTRFKLSVPHKNSIFQLGAPNAPGDGCVIKTGGAIDQSAGDSFQVWAGVNVDLSAKENINVKADEELSLNGQTSFMWGETRLTLLSDASLEGGAPHVFMYGQESTSVGSGTKMTLAAPKALLGGTTVTVVATKELILEGPIVTIRGNTINIEKGDVNINGKDVTITSTGLIRLNK